MCSNQLHMEEFNPSNPEYKKIEDLPPEGQENYVNLPEGGFVTKSALEEEKLAESEARIKNKHRSFSDKLLGKNKVDKMDVLEDYARFLNDTFDKNLQDTEKEKMKIDAEEYLKRLKNIKEQVPEDELFKSRQRLEESFQKVAYESSGTVNLTKDGFRFEFSYSSTLDEGTQKAIKNNVRELGFSWFIPKHQMKFWRKLESFIIYNDDKPFDLLTLIPEGCDVVFYPINMLRGGVFSPGLEEMISEKPMSKTIIIMGGMECIGSIVVLLHEIGHIIDSEKLKKLGLGSLTKSNDKDAASNAEQLRKERTASAFTLKTMRPLLSKNPELKKDVLNFLIKIALEGYNQSIREKLPKKN